MTKSSFGTLADGTAVDLYTLTNAKGVEMRVTNYGAHHRVAEGARIGPARSATSCSATTASTTT